MNGRKIDDVEAHCSRVVDSSQTIAEGRSTIRPALRGAGKKFIPGGRARGNAIDDHPWRWSVLGGAVARCVSRHQHLKLTEVGDPIYLSVVAVAQSFGEFAQTFGVGTARP